MSQEVLGTVLVRPFPDDLDVIQTVLEGEYWRYDNPQIATVDHKSGEVAFIAIIVPHRQVKRLKKALKKRGCPVSYI